MGTFSEMANKLEPFSDRVLLDAMWYLFRLEHRGCFSRSKLIRIYRYHHNNLHCFVDTFYLRCVSSALKTCPNNRACYLTNRALQLHKTACKRWCQLIFSRMYLGEHHSCTSPLERFLTHHQCEKFLIPQILSYLP
jgi:hypothetical protein